MADDAVLGPGAKSATEQFEDMTVEGLKEELKEAGESTSGKKEELVERLAESQAAQTERTAAQGGTTPPGSGTATGGTATAPAGPATPTT